ncbi:redoxin domain-containing protein [Candidatus Woesebacteria bacterium]|nr:redoxin domain-containing protein [Candidatus Woesebacteria bacterium]
MDKKSILISVIITLSFIVITVLIISLLNKNNENAYIKGNAVKSSETQDSSMSSHHRTPSPADNSAFLSLLNKPAPDFTLESFKGSEVTLSKLRGKNVVIFFSEGAMCYPGCWNQIDAFVGDTKLFDDKNTLVYTIVVDPRQDWKEAVDKDTKMASANVLLDTNKQASNDYEVLTVDSSMHRGQFPGHTYLIVDKDGIVRFEKDDVQMGIRNKELFLELDKLI